MLKLAKKIKRIFVKYRFTQRHDIEGRWKMIETLLPSSPHWFLDIGTNNGDTQKRLASKGHYALGLEVDRKATSPVMPRNTAVMVTRVVPETFLRMPRFDCVIMLSVFHRIWALQDPETAKAILKAAASKAPMMIFEGCSRHARYTNNGKSPAPEFDDLNLEQSLKWHQSLLEEIIPGAKVTYIGSAETIHTKDPRPLYHITGIPSPVQG